MKVRVYYHSGVVQDFVVSEHILALDFTSMAVAAHGRMRRMEFL